jgi:hypothetical protein
LTVEAIQWVLLHREHLWLPVVHPLSCSQRETTIGFRPGDRGGHAVGPPLQRTPVTASCASSQ